MKRQIYEQILIFVTTDKNIPGAFSSRAGSVVISQTVVIETDNCSFSAMFEVITDSNVEQ